MRCGRSTKTSKPEGNNRIRFLATWSPFHDINADKLENTVLNSIFMPANKETGVPFNSSGSSNKSITETSVNDKSQPDTAS